MEQAQLTTLAIDDLLPAIKANDEKVLRQLYTANFPAVARYIEKNSGAADDAKDIYQEAFIAAWRNIQMDKFEALNPSALSAYIFQIAKNKWIDHLRSARTKKTIRLDNVKGNGDENNVAMSENGDYIDMVKHQMKLLGTKCFDLLTRFYYHKQSLREIAQHFNWTEPSAKNNKYRCLGELRTLVKNKIQKCSL